MPLTFVSLPFYFLKVTQFEAIFSSYQTPDASKSEVQLPINMLNHASEDILRYTGSIDISGVDLTIYDHVYLPHYDGHLKLFLNGTEIFDSGTEQAWISAQKIPNLLLKLPVDTAETSFLLDFSLDSSSSAFLNLSEFYLGTLQDFWLPYTRNTHYYGVLRAAILGAAACIFFFFTALLILGKPSQQVIPPILIMIGLILNDIGILANSFPNLVEIRPYLLALLPLSATALSQFSSDIFQPRKVSSKARDWLVTVSIVCVLLYLGSDTRLNMQYANLYVTAPIVLLSVAHTTTRTIIWFLRYKSIQSGIFAASILSLIIGLLHDVLLRYGIMSTGVLITAFSSLAMIFGTMLVFVNKVFSVQEQLQSQNEQMSAVITEQIDELKASHRREVIREQANAASAEQLRIHAELHDGVLNNLSMINIIAKNKKSGSRSDIYKLSTFAMSEVRMILSSRKPEEENLFDALSNVKQYCLPKTGDQPIDIKWNLDVLSDYPKANAKFIVEIVRILQEALHNAIVRAECKSLSITSECSDSGMYSIVIKNSGGHSLESRSREGFGLRNMEIRAQAIRANLSIQPHDSGACLTLTLPAL